MDTETLLRCAYGANILILAPVLAGLQYGPKTPVVAALGGQVTESEGLRTLVLSLWSAVLLLSGLGLLAPRPLWPLLAFQVIYKSIWLAPYVVPVARREGPGAAPWGPASVFMAIVILWPVLLARLWAEGGVAFN